MSESSRAEEWPRPLKQLQNAAPVVGGIGMLACLVLVFLPQTKALMCPAYLIAFIYWFGIAMGGASLTMLHHLTGGSWGLLVRRPLEAAALVILPLAIFFIPIALNLPVLYPWARDADPFKSEILKKVVYLNPTGFLARSLGYFVVWSILAVVLNRLSRAQDSTTSDAPSVWLSRLSAPGLGVIFLSGSFAAIDWVMSIEPEWPSSIYPAMLITGWGLATWACAILVCGTLRRTRPMEDVATPARFQDLANLSLAFVMLWAYTSFMQYLIIWSGNLPEEIPWYLRRSRGGWQYFVFALVVFHFFAPFFILLSRAVKRRAPKLMTLAGAILLLRFVDGCWLVLPARVRDPLSSAIGVNWLQVLLALMATISLGGVCIGFFLFFLRQAPLVPVNDPAVAALAHSAEHADPEDELDTLAPHAGGTVRHA